MCGEKQKRNTKRSVKNTKKPKMDFDFLLSNGKEKRKKKRGDFRAFGRRESARAAWHG